MVRRGLVAVCMAAAIGVVAGGCGESGSSGGSSGATIRQDTQQTDQIRAGGSLTVGAAVPISQLNPAVKTFAWEGVLFSLLWNGLTRWTEDGRLAPDLATEWTPSEDQRTWTFRLRDGVRFHDGTPLTARKVADSFTYYLDERTVTQERVRIQDIETVTATDDLTVEFRLARPNAVLPEAIPDVRVIDVDKLGAINRAPNGTGPFRVAEFVPDDHLTLARNADYFGDRAPLDEIELVKAVDATAGATALRSGDLQVLYDLPIGDAQQVDSDPNVALVLNEPYSWAQTWKIDTTTPPFDRLAARQALSYATDRRQILAKAYRGIGQIAPTNNLIPPDSASYARSGLTEYPYDLDMAKRLFAEAGVKEGDSITWWGPAGIQPEKTIAAQILQASLAEIGIKLKIENREVSAWTTKFIPVGQRFPGFIAPTGSAAPLEPAFMLSAVRRGRCECNWDAPQFEQDYDVAIGTGDAAARDAAWGRVQAIVSREVPVLIPLLTTMVSATRENVAGVWSAQGGTQLHIEGAGFTGR